MIRIAITAAAYVAIATALRFGSVGYEAKRTADGQISSGWKGAPYLPRPLHALHSERFSKPGVRGSIPFRDANISMG